MRIFMMLRCLEDEKVWALASKFVGLSIKYLKTVNDNCDYFPECILKIHWRGMPQLFLFWPVNKGK